MVTMNNIATQPTKNQAEELVTFLLTTHVVSRAVFGGGGGGAEVLH